MRVRVGHRLNLNDSGSDFDSSFRFRFLTILDSDSFKRQGKKSLHVLNFSQYISGGFFFWSVQWAAKLEIEMKKFQDSGRIGMLVPVPIDSRYSMPNPTPNPLPY